MHKTSFFSSLCTRLVTILTPLSGWRQIWIGSIPPVERQFVHSLLDEEYLHLLFMPVSLRRTPAAIFPHITFVSNVCQAQRSIASGLEPHAPLDGNAKRCMLIFSPVHTDSIDGCFRTLACWCCNPTPSTTSTGLELQAVEWNILVLAVPNISRSRVEQHSGGQSFDRLQVATYVPHEHKRMRPKTN